MDEETLRKTAVEKYLQGKERVAIYNIPEGTISLIRFIRSDRKRDIFGEDFEVPQDLVSPMSGLRSLPIYIKSRFIRETNGLPLFNTHGLPGFLHIPKPGKRCPGA